MVLSAGASAQQLLREISPEAASSDPAYATDLFGTAYFRADDGVSSAPEPCTA